MKTILLITLILAASGCTLLSGGFDKVGSRMVKEAVAYCSNPLYRREALYILVNGALASQDIEIGIICPGDEVEGE